MFRAVRLSIIGSLFTVHSALVYVIQVWRQLFSRIRMELQMQFCEISASGWFYYKEICYDAGSHERKILSRFSYPMGVRQSLLGTDSLDSVCVPKCFSFYTESLIVINIWIMCMIAGFRRYVYEICACLRYYAASSGNYLPTSRDSLSVPSLISWPLKKKKR